MQPENRGTSNQKPALRVDMVATMRKALAQQGINVPDEIPSDPSLRVDIVANMRRELARQGKL